MIRIGLITLMGALLIFMSACTEDDKTAKEADYDTTKKMVIDILQTDDGKKALKELMTDEEMKKQLIIDSDIVKESINQMLTSNKGEEMWSNLFKDPAFATDFAESMSGEQKKLMKELMNDATFQKQMLELLQDPEMTKQMLILMKSQDFRSHLEETIQQTLDTPIFKTKIQDILLKAAEKQGDQQEQTDAESDQMVGDKDEDDDTSAD